MTTRIAGWLLCVGATALLPGASGGAEDVFKEPPLEFALELDGVATDLADGEVREITVGGRVVTAGLALKPTRLLRTPDLSFRFPREHKLERTDEIEGTTWTLGGERDVVVLVRVRGSKPLGDGIDEVIEGFEEEIGHPPTSVVPAEATLGGEKRVGKRAEFQRGSVRFVADVFQWGVKRAGYIVAFTEVILPDEGTRPAPVSARPLITETWKPGGAWNVPREPPLEFTVTLNGVASDFTSGETRQVRLGSAVVSARMVVKPTRLLRAPELSFRYPREGAIDRIADAEDGSLNWTINGSGEVVLLVRTATKGDKAKAVQRVIDAIASNMGPPTKTSPVETRFGGHKRSGTRAEFRTAEKQVVTELFPFGAGRTGYVLAFSAVRIQGGTEPAAVPIRTLVEQTLTLDP